MQNLLASSSGGASENCERAAIASTSGYHQVEGTLRLCDERINSCKTGCGDATIYLNANKERLYNACREKAFQDQVNSGPPLPPDRFNPMWDHENKANLDSQFQSLLTRVDTSRSTCETGTAATNRNSLSTASNEMNSTSRSANQCVCQLNSTNADCSKTAVGPADCSKNPALPGCAKVVDNCFDLKNTSLKCVCFRNPESIECKGSLPTLNVKTTEMNANAFAGAKAADTRGSNAELSGMAAGKTTEGVSNVGVGNSENYAASSDPISVTAGASDSGISSAGNPGATTPAAAVGAGAPSGGGSGAGGTSSLVGPNSKDEGGVVKKLSGFFETAKSALTGALKKGSGNSSSGDYRDGGDGQNQRIDHKRFRPRGMVRGIASDAEIAGKFEDIWKVMNKQYKVQDQKDNFIFDAEKK